jgi:hypothetical protein
MAGAFVYESRSATTLITYQEAALPDDDIEIRGISLGPRITLLNPHENSGLINTPFQLRIRIEGRGGARVDQNSILITYLKKPAIDLTQRIAPFFKLPEIAINDAIAPRGHHRIRVDAKDTDGRASSMIFMIRIAE